MRWLNTYGPTESTVVTTWWEANAGAPESKTVPIGRPIDNARVYVLDRNRQPVPVGVAGSMRWRREWRGGYLNRPGLTAERFVPDPFAAQPGSRLYRTGDRVRWHADGHLEFLGRLDQQVKIRGFRIEPGEVERCCYNTRRCGRPWCWRARTARAASVWWPTPWSRPVCPAADFVRSAGPAAQVHGALGVLVFLGLAADARQTRPPGLPAPDRQPDAQGYLAPRTPAEEALANIWAEVARRPGARGRTDCFFGLGGHSLLATQVAARVRGVSGHRVALRLLFEQPTVAALAQALEQARRRDADPGHRWRRCR